MRLALKIFLGAYLAVATAMGVGLGIKKEYTTAAKRYSFANQAEFEKKQEEEKKFGAYQPTNDAVLNGGFYGGLEGLAIGLGVLGVLGVGSFGRMIFKIWKERDVMRAYEERNQIRGWADRDGSDEKWNGLG